MDLGLEGATVVVSGGSKGMGRAAAEHFAAEADRIISIGAEIRHAAFRCLPETEALSALTLLIEENQALGIGERTVDREWAVAQAWLYACMRRPA